MIYLLGLGASAFSSPACSSRVALSRVAQPVSTARVPLPLMCDAPEEAPAAEAAAEPAADDSAEDKPARRARAPRAPKTKLEDLVTDVEIQGTVRSVQSYGAFVDIGAETDGLDLDRLAEAHAPVAKHRPVVRLAVNRRYVPTETALTDGDEVALITPVSGG